MKNMLIPIKRIKKEDKYELMKTVQLVDVKGYLQKEYERAAEREKTITELENKIEDYKKTELKYHAMLVVQQETQARIERQDNIIKELKEERNFKDDEIRLAKAKQVDIKLNAEAKLKEKDNKIKELKKEIRELKKSKGAKK